jgi:hypothetical protein
MIGPALYLLERRRCALIGGIDRCDRMGRSERGNARVPALRRIERRIHLYLQLEADDRAKGDAA